MLRFTIELFGGRRAGVPAVPAAPIDGAGGELERLKAELARAESERDVARAALFEAETFEAKLRRVVKDEGGPEITSRDQLTGVLFAAVLVRYREVPELIELLNKCDRNAEAWSRSVLNGLSKPRYLEMRPHPSRLEEPTPKKPN